MTLLTRFISIVVLISGTIPLFSQNSYNINIKEAARILNEYPAKADSIGRTLLSNFAQNPPDNDSLVAKTYFLLAQANYYLGKRNLALNYYQKSLQTKFAANSLRHTDACWNNMAVIYERQLRYHEASEAYYKSLAIAEQMKDSANIISSWMNIGILGSNTGRSDEVISILNYCYNYWLHHDDPDALAEILINLANAYFQVNPALAEKHYAEALSILRKTGNTRGTAIALLNLAGCESKNGNFSKSNELLQETVDLCTRNDMPEYLGLAYRIIAGNEIDANGDLNLARVYLDQSKVLAEKFDRLDQLNQIKEVELKLSVRSGSYNSFIGTLNDYIKFNENISSENAKIIQSEFQAIYEVKNITEQNVRLEESVLKKKPSTDVVAAGVTRLRTGNYYYHSSVQKVETGFCHHVQNERGNSEQFTCCSLHTSR